jgi:glycerol-3-phosphate acyltransferase PlsX
LKPVALDAMGGDHAPAATVAGAVAAVARLGLPVVLVGDKARIEAELDTHSQLPEGLTVVHAGSTIDMEESPGPALLRKRDSSIIVATNLVREGRACAVVSAGNSGAAMGAAKLRLGLLPGVERPAIATMMPNRRGSVILLDAGATVDAQPEHLRDFALVGSVYAHCLLKLDRPRVGLLNIGTEDSKGNALTKAAYDLLRQAPITFVGHVEGQQIALGDVDVVVCDGFVGNAILKATEGYAELFWWMFREALNRPIHTRIAAWFIGRSLRGVADELDYASHGGAMLVGVNGICVIGHGRSSADAVASAIRVAGDLAAQGVVDQLVRARRENSTAELTAAVAGEGDSLGS